MKKWLLGGFLFLYLVFALAAHPLIRYTYGKELERGNEIGVFAAAATILLGIGFFILIFLLFSGNTWGNPALLIAGAETAVLALPAVQRLVAYEWYISFYSDTGFHLWSAFTILAVLLAALLTRKYQNR